VVDRADLDLQMEVLANHPPDSSDDLGRKRARFSSGPPYSSDRSLIAELRN
jgi:hypothetical protein